MSPLLRVGISEMDGLDSQEYLQYVVWVPGKSSSLLIIKENDIFFKSTPTNQEIVRITADGEKGTIFNGINDWNYKGS